jgi:DNA-binding Lrp family transcriptional regulator
MIDQPAPSQPNDHGRVLRFACDCASAAPVAADPWVAVAKQHKLEDGTKELILDALYRQPLTVAQLAHRLRLSPPAVHRHVREMLASELIREASVAPPERRSTLERYYRPAFPIVLATDRRAFEPILATLADAIADRFRSEQPALAAAFAGTSLAEREESVATVLHYLYATAVRMARAQLEAEGVLPAWPEHEDGSRWIWWAEEAPETEVNLTTPAHPDGSDPREDEGRR